MSQTHPMTRLEVVDVETLEVKKAIYLSGHNAQEIQAMSDSLLRNLNTFQFFVRSTPSAAPVVVVATTMAAPEGFVLVPVKPTPKMVDATFNHPRLESESHNARNRRIYAAMIAAAPAVAQGD